MTKKDLFIHLSLGLLLAFLSFFMFNKMIKGEILSDLLAHATATMKLIRSNDLPSRFGYFLTSAVFSGFSTDFKYVLFVSSLILTGSVIFKYIISYFYLKKNATIPNYYLVLLTFGLCFVTHIPNPEFIIKNKWYLLHSVPTVWHNSTIIFSLPFSILLFIVSINNLNKFSVKKVLLITILVIVNNICKPSFFFAYLPAYFVILLFSFKYYEKKFWLSLIPLMIGVFMLAFEYLNIYGETVAKANASGIEFVYFKHYLLLIKQLKVSLFHPFFSILIIHLVSFSFPLAMLFIDKKVSKEEIFCWLLVVFSIVIYSLIRETGPRASHGNFGWQKVPTTYLLFLVYSKTLITNFRNFDWKKYIAVFFLVVHVLSGFYYYAFIISTKNYF